MFSFKEDQKAQRGPFEGEKNAKAWGVQERFIFSYVPTTNISPPTPFADL